MADTLLLKTFSRKYYGSSEFWRSFPVLHNIDPGGPEFLLIFNVNFILGGRIYANPENVYPPNFFSSANFLKIFFPLKLGSHVSLHWGNKK